MSRPSSARLWLLPLVPFYRLALGLREFRLRQGREAVRRLRFPVVSIGNLSAGGTGKTPLTIALAQSLSRRGVEVDVLSRGYGRRGGARAARVDSGGTDEEFGDEPLLIARERRSSGIRRGQALRGRTAGRARDRSFEGARLEP